jgi:hypothetical protein
VRNRALKTLAAEHLVEELTDGLWLSLADYDNRLGLTSARLDAAALFWD